MFESVAPETFHTRSRRLFYETLPVSIAAHALGIAGMAAATLCTVVFPLQSPQMTVAYNLTALPDPPPPPPPPPAQPAVVAERRALLLPPPRPLPIVAPTIIPETIPVVAAPPQPMPVPEPSFETTPKRGPASTGAGTSAKPEAEGAAGGTLHGVPGALLLAADGRVHVERGDKLPLEVVEQEYPHYPEDARRKRLEDRVVVRYVVGRNGRVIDVLILDHAKEPMFDVETVETVRTWRFRPLRLNGKKEESCTSWK